MTWPIWDGTSPGSPLEALLSRAAASGVYTVADESDREDLLSEMAAADLDTTVVRVHRENAGPGRELEYTTDGGTNWRSLATVGLSTPYAMAAGVVTVPVNNSTEGLATVNFPSGRFSVTPIVQLTLGNTGYSAVVNSVNATQLQVRITRYIDTPQNISRPVNWLAIQMTPNAAAG